MTPQQMNKFMEVFNARDKNLRTQLKLKLADTEEFMVSEIYQVNTEMGIYRASLLSGSTIRYFGCTDVTYLDIVYLQESDQSEPKMPLSKVERKK